MNRDTELNKAFLLAQAIKELRNDEEELQELKAAAFEALLLNPGSGFGDWEQILIEEYATEVVDAFGVDLADSMAALSDLWETPYSDIASGLEYTFSIWAEAFSTDAAVRMYYDMIEERKRIVSAK